ncbi:MAG: 2-octaprenyl-6-methoxyphenyl hydroxylase, partial [Chromatiales bacterium]|nr:2-octaprenyl-6-methoxyphenyl hydroxylase [Chromatiales bacterium]
ATLTNNNVQLENIRAVEQVTTTDDGVTCDVDRGDGTDKFNADLLIAADGGESSLRDLLGIGERVRDYAQVALSAIVKAAKPVAMTAFERFTPDGPLALLPMRDDCYGLVWCMAPDQASKLVGGTSSQIEGALEVRSGAALGKLELQSPPVCFPLKAIRANSNIADRCVLLGDAAHQLHPVAGQGLNLGLRDVADLAERLSVALRDGIDIGDAAHLGAYARARRADQRRVFRATDSLVRIFSSSILPLGLARQSAMLAMQMSPALKKRFALAAMGLEPPVSAMVGGAL